MKIKTRNINNCVKRITIEGDKPIHILVDNSQEIKCIEIFGDMNSIVLKRNYFSILNTTDIQNLNDIEINQLYSKRLKELKLITSENTIKAKKEHFLSQTIFYIDDFKNTLSLAIKENSGVTTINIDGECNLKINNTELKCNLQYIKENFPQDFFNLIRKYEDYINLSKDNEFEIDVRLDSSSLVTLYFSKIQTKNSSDVILRYDTLKNELDLDDLDIDEKTKTKLSSSYKELIQKLNKLGYKLHYSHDQSEKLWGWSDVIVPINNIDEKLIKEISSIFYNHENEIKSIEKKIYSLF